MSAQHAVEKRVCPASRCLLLQGDGSGGDSIYGGKVRAAWLCA